MVESKSATLKNHRISSHWWFGDPNALWKRVNPLHEFNDWTRALLKGRSWLPAIYPLLPDLVFLNHHGQHGGSPTAPRYLILEKKHGIPWDTLKISLYYPTCHIKTWETCSKKNDGIFSREKNPSPETIGAPSHWAQLLRSTWVTLPQSRMIGCCLGGWGWAPRFISHEKKGHLEVQEGGDPSLIFPDLSLLGGWAPT